MLGSEIIALSTDNMLTSVKRAAKAALGIKPLSPRVLFPEATEAELNIIARVAPYTMTTPEKLWGLLKAVEHVSRRNIPGDYVECGVWRGGSSMAAALAFQGRNDVARTFWLYDTYEGMTEPTVEDRKILDMRPAEEKYRATLAEGRSDWCYASLEDVQANIASTGYANARFIKGKVEDTLPTTHPERVSLLRLDTDWYLSTKCELEVLWDRLSPGGIMILDDYGCWAGAKQAVDEFFGPREAPLMHRLDVSGRLIVKH